MTDLKKLIEEGSTPPESAAGKTAVLLGSALLGQDALQGVALGMATHAVSPQAGDHLAAFARSGNIGAGVAGAVIGAIKPASKNDEPAAPYIEKEQSPEYVQSMEELGWGPGR